MKIIRQILIVLIFLIILLAIVYGFLPKPLLVETAEVKRSHMNVTIEEEGKTRVINRYVLSAPVAGFALRIDLDVGDTVKKGEIITALEPLRSPVLDPRSMAEAKARVAAAEASLKAAMENTQAAKADADLAGKERERIKQLFKESLVAQESLDTAEAYAHRTEAALRFSEFSVDVARAEREAALTALKFSAAQEPGASAEKVEIRTPVNGRVLKINHESEGVVIEGQALIEIGDPRSLEVEVDVLSADAVRISPGTPVLFDRWGGDAPLLGTVRHIEPAGFTKISALGVEEQRVLVISDILSPSEQWTQLGDGYRVEARFILWEDDNVLQIPSSALFRHEKDWAVFVMIHNKAIIRTVKTGHRNGLSAEIVSGLSEGDKVIIHPDRALEDGQSVRLRAER